MRTCFIILAIIAVLVAAAPPSKKGGKAQGTGSNQNKKPKEQQPNNVDNEDDQDQTNQNNNNTNQEYCYDSSWSFKCRQTSPNEYDLECKINNVDGNPCFPNLVTLIQASAPLSSISYPVQNYEAYENANQLNAQNSIVTAENIEAIHLQAPFQHIPANAFAHLPQLKRITLEALDGVRNVQVDQHAFSNTNAKHLHLIGHNARQILAQQQVQWQQFNTVSFSDVELDCYQQNQHQQQQQQGDNNNQDQGKGQNQNQGNNNNNNNQDQDNQNQDQNQNQGQQQNEQSWSSHNQSCQHVFNNLQHVQTLNVASIYVKGDELDQNVFQPLWNNLKKLVVDVVYQTPRQQQHNNSSGDNQSSEENGGQSSEENDNQNQNDDDDQQQQQQTGNFSTNSTRQHRGYFPIETIAFMNKLEEAELYLYEPIVGITIDESTQVPLPVSKTLTRLVLSCRYCQQIHIDNLGKWFPNLQHLTIAAPIQPSVVTEECLKQWPKLEELVIYDSDVQGFQQNAFRSSQSLKHLTIKYAEVQELNQQQLQHVKDNLQSLNVVGTQIKQIDVSQLNHVTQLDLSHNHLTTIQRNMFPQKASYSELNISYNPVRRVQNGFLNGIDLTNHVLHINGWQIDQFDINAVEGIQNLRVVDISQNQKLKQLQVNDYNKVPHQVQRIVVGRSPFLKLEDQNGQTTKMLRERNITLVVEGQVACTCKMNWINDLQKDHPHLIEINNTRATCSRQGTDVDNIPESFWKNPTVANFLKSNSGNQNNNSNTKSQWCKNQKPGNQ